MRRSLLVPLLAIGWAVPCLSAHATSYSFATFDAPGASLVSAGGTTITGINNVGQISGDLLSGNYPSGFVYNTTTSALTSYSDYDVRGLNDSGYLVAMRLNGDVAFLIYPNGDTAELRQNPVPTVTGINNSLDTVGYFSYPSRQFTSYQGFIETLGTFGFDTGPTIYEDPLGVRTNQTLTRFYDINNVGQVAGTVVDSANQLEGFLFDRATGTYRPVNVPGGSTTQAFGLNDTGQLVGSFYAPALGATEGFVLDLATGVYSTLSAPGAVTTVATGITNGGVAAGYYIDANNVSHGFFATPQATASVPEPATVVLLGSLVLGAGIARRGAVRRVIDRSGA